MFKKEKIKDLHYSVSGILNSSEIEEKSKVILAKYGEQVKVSGFRPGHIPLNILQQRYGAEATQDAVNDLMNKDLEEFIKDKKIKLAGSPKANLEKFVPGGDAEYTLEFDVLPELPKIELEKITLTKNAKPVAEKDVEAALNNIRKNRSEFQKQDDKYKLAKDDLAVIDFTGFIGSEKFEGGEGKNHNLVLGSGQFIPGFEDQVIGHTLNDEFDVNVKFPNDYHAANLAGKNARFAVKVNEVRHPILPAIDDELAKTVGMESLNKLMEHIRKIIGDNNEESAKAEMRNELLDVMSEKVKLELPQSLVDQEFEAAEKGKDFDEKKERKEAERRVKLGLILAEWGSQNNIKVSREELQGAIWSEAARYPNPQEVYEFYNKDKNALSMLNGMLFERKTLDAMIEKCKIK